MNKQQEEIKRALFDAEITVMTMKGTDNNTLSILYLKVNRVRVVQDDSVAVELIANRFGWECFTDYLQVNNYLVDTRRWYPFTSGLYQYDLYVRINS